MINMSSARSVCLLLVCCILQMMLFSAEAAAQERLQLSASSQQGAVATYSEPLDVQRHTLWGDRGAGIDVRTFRIAGSVRNPGDAPVRLVVFAVPDDTYRQMARRTAGTSLSADRGFLALFSVDIRPSASVDLRDHAPRDAAALQRMMMAGPVRFGVLAIGFNGERAVRIEALNSPRERQRTMEGSFQAWAFVPFVRTRSGEVSLLEARTFPGDAFFPGESFFPGDAFFPGETFFPGESFFPGDAFLPR